MKTESVISNHGRTNYSDFQDQIIGFARAMAIIIACGIIGVWITLF